MAKIYGQLEKAQLELLASAPADAPTGYVFYDTSSDQMKIKTPSGFSTVVSKGLPPIGTIVAWVGGYMTDGSNTSFVSVLGNSVSAVNALVNGDGYYVCDGSAPNNPASPIFNAAGKYLPNLTDSRFLQGSTSAGGFGGQNSFQIATSDLPNLSLPFSGTTGPTGVSSSISVADSNHFHGSNTIEARIRNSVGSTSLQTRLNDPALAGSWNATNRNDFAAASVASSTLISTASSTQGSTSLGTSNATVATTSNLPSHTHSFSGTASASFANTAIENRPVYFNSFFIMRIS